MKFNWKNAFLFQVYSTDQTCHIYDDNLFLKRKKKKNGNRCLLAIIIDVFVFQWQGICFLIYWQQLSVVAVVWIVVFRECVWAAAWKTNSFGSKIRIFALTNSQLCPKRNPNNIYELNVYYMMSWILFQWLYTIASKQINRKIRKHVIMKITIL